MYHCAWLPQNSARFIEPDDDVFNPEPSMDVVMYVAAMCVLNEDNGDSDNRPAKQQHYSYNHSCTKAAV